MSNWVYHIPARKNMFFCHKHILVFHPLCMELRGKACSSDSTHSPMVEKTKRYTESCLKYFFNQKCYHINELGDAPKIYLRLQAWGIKTVSAYGLPLPPLASVYFSMLQWQANSAHQNLSIIIISNWHLFYEKTVRDMKKT